MNAFTKVDKATFLKFAAEHAEKRYEYVRGRIVQQMTGGTLGHGQVARRIVRAIEDQIDLSTWTVIADRGVETPQTIRYPDAALEQAGAALSSLSTDKPALVVEVLSPSTSATDLDVKPAEYLSLASLDAYIIASQDEAAMLVYQRGRNGRFPAKPREVGGLDEQFTVKGRGFEVAFRLTDIYKGIV